MRSLPHRGCWIGSVGVCSAGLAAFALSLAATAQSPIPSSAAVEEDAHTIEVTLSRDGATLKVTRSLFNPTISHAQVDLPIPLPCTATLAEFAVAELDATGSPSWRPAELLSPAAARTEFDDYFNSTFSAPTHAVNSDSGMLLTRSGWSCEAELAIFPIPPLQRRSVAYELFIPSHYAAGQHTIELPSFDAYGRTAELEVAPISDSGLLAWVDAQELGAQGRSLSGAQSHTIVVSSVDQARGRVQVADLDLAALVGQTPAAAALLTGDAGLLPRMQEAVFEAPTTLATLPAVRRAVVLIDASRSVSAADREQLQALAGAYAAALVDQRAQLEVVLFDRDVERVYHDFVPASWVAEDLPKLAIADGNGSEVGEALAFARSLLAAPTPNPGADWIIVLSDLTLRSDFDLAAEQVAAEASGVRLHVVRELSSGPTFGPAASADPWTVIARAAGGMAWDTSGGADPFAEELVRPTRIWNLGVELEFVDASRHSQVLSARLDAGERADWIDHAWDGPALARATFVGEVWGQARAWTEQPSVDVGRRLAGALVSDRAQPGISEAVATALAFHAEVVSEYSSAWALAKFDGTAPAPHPDLGLSGHGFGGSYGSSSHCGGVRSSRGSGIRPVIGFDALAQEILDRCASEADGGFVFETTGIEIVAVTGGDRCLEAQAWATDISPTDAIGRKRVSIAHAGGRVTQVDVVAL